MEQWKEIPGYEGLYEASDFGRIRTAEGKTTSNARFSRRVWKQRILKQKFSRRKGIGSPDARVHLWKDAKCNEILVSRLVALTWCDGYQEDMTVNHKDGNTLNNKADNLEWISIAGNINHAFDNVMMPTQKPCILVDSSGNKEWYRSQVMASKSIGRADSYISQCLIKGRTIRSSDGEMYGIIF